MCTAGTERTRRHAGNVAMAVVVLGILFVLVVTFLTAARQRTGTRKNRLLMARADAIAAAGVHVAIAALRLDNLFRKPIVGQLDGGRYEVKIQDGRQQDASETVWIKEDKYLRVTSTGTVDGVTCTLETLLNQRNIFTEFAVSLMGSGVANAE